MKNILKDQYIDYLVKLKANPHPNLSVDKGAIIIRTENTSDPLFEIIDKKESILTQIGQGSATYCNSCHKSVEIIDYENFVNQLPKECQKDIKRADFIIHHDEGTDFFIINELSQSEDIRNKRKKAILQLNNAVMHLTRCVDTNAYISRFNRKICIFSNKDRLINTGNNPALAFDKIKEYLPDPIPIKFQQITNAGFEAIETATFEL